MPKILGQICAGLGLLALSPLLLPVMFLVWWQDKHSPFYIAPRTGLDGEPFKMMKLRSMVINADKSGVDSTAADDKRITKVGHFIRRYKLDEVTQLINVFIGDMSLVGPRPNVKRETELYAGEEKLLLSVRPGITDFASIVFSDEGDILEGSSDPDADYERVIKPGKNELGIFYVKHRSTLLDLKLIFLTLLVLVSKPAALKQLCAILRGLGADEELVDLAARTKSIPDMLSSAPYTPKRVS